MVKGSEKGALSRLLRQTSCLFMEIPLRSLKTEFKCHLRLSNGHRAGGDPSKRRSDKRPLLNMAGPLGKPCARPARRRAPLAGGPGRSRAVLGLWARPRRPGSQPRLGGRGRGGGWRARMRGGGSCNTTSYLPPYTPVRAPPPPPHP